MTILAWIAIFIIALNVVLMPLLIGKPRGNYTFASWVSTLISVAIFLPLALRVLGYV